MTMRTAMTLKVKYQVPPGHRSNCVVNLVDEVELTGEHNLVMKCTSRTAGDKDTSKEEDNHAE